jgi:hypothetical protein
MVSTQIWGVRAASLHAHPKFGTSHGKSQRPVYFTLFWWFDAVDSRSRFSGDFQKVKKHQLIIKYRFYEGCPMA